MTTENHLYCNLGIMTPYDEIHFEQMLRLTKAHLFRFSLGVFVELEPSLFFSIVLSLSSQNTSSIFAPCAPWQQCAGSCISLCCFFQVHFMAELSSYPAST